MRGERGLIQSRATFKGETENRVEKADRFLADSFVTEQLGKDLGELVSEVGAPLLAVKHLTRLPSEAGNRACFLLRFEGDFSLKGRRFTTDAEAQRVCRLLELMDQRHFPRVVAHRGSALLTEWRTGRLLTADSMSSELLEDCGRLLAEVHRLESKITGS